MLYLKKKDHLKKWKLLGTLRVNVTSNAILSKYIL